MKGGPLMTKVYEKEGSYIIMVSPDSEKEKELIEQAKKLDYEKRKENEYWDLGTSEKKGIDATASFSFTEKDDDLEIPFLD